MKSEAAVGTEKASLAERHFINSSATAASPARVSWINFHDARTACYSFVFQHPYESSPASIAYTFGEMVISDHIGNLQILNSDSSKPASEFVAEFVKEVKPLVADFIVLPSQEETSLVPIPAAFLLPAQSPMQQLQSLFTFDEETGIIHSFPIGQGGEVLNADINPNSFCGRMFGGCFWHFTSEDGKPLPSLVSLNGKSFDFAFGNSVQNDWNVADFGSIKTLVADKPKPLPMLVAKCLRVSDALNSAFKTRKAFLFTLQVFHPAKETLKCFINPLRNILSHLRMNFGMFTGKMIVEIKFPYRFLSGLIRFDTQVKKFIVNCLASVKLLEENLLLALGRIQTITITPELHSGVKI